MTNSNMLVLEGDDIKYRLLAERTETKTPIHIDWLRATFFRRNVIPSFETVVNLFPSYGSDSYGDMPSVIKREIIHKTIRDFQNEHHDAAFTSAMHDALDIAGLVCAAMGKEFTVCAKIKNGRDFYKFMWAIERNGAEVGWVGFLATGTSDSKKAQDNTIHVNLYGAACTFGASGWADRMAKLIASHKAKITRVDLALDFFDGLPNGRTMESIRQEYNAGLMNVNGKRPKCRMVGDWSSEEDGGERSFYIGSKENGKETNIYEKGDQLFGREIGNPWIRVELRRGNKLCVIPSDILLRPADFFAGASPWHAQQLAFADAEFSAQAIPCEKRLPLQTVEAEVTRAMSWALRSAAPTLSALVKFATESALFEICDKKKLPQRISKFSESELARAFKSVFTDGGQLKKPFSLVRDSGTSGTYSIFTAGGPSPLTC